MISTRVFVLHNRAILRWHLWGVCIGTLLGSLVTLRLYLLTDHHGPLRSLLTGLPALWLACYIFASPFLIALLFGWRRFAERHPHVERPGLPRILCLFVVGNMIALVANVLLVAFLILERSRTEPLTQRLLRFSIEVSIPMGGLLWLATICWFVLPRIWLTLPLASTSASDPSRYDNDS